MRPSPQAPLPASCPRACALGSSSLPPQQPSSPAPSCPVPPPRPPAPASSAPPLLRRPHMELLLRLSRLLPTQAEGPGLWLPSAVCLSLSRGSSAGVAGAHSRKLCIEAQRFVSRWAPSGPALGHLGASATGPCPASRTQTLVLEAGALVYTKRVMFGGFLTSVESPSFLLCFLPPRTPDITGILARPEKRGP